MALLNPFSNAFGLDLGDRAFRLVQFKKNRHHSPPYTLTAWGEIPVPEGLMDHGEIKDMDKVVSLVSQLVRQAEGSLSGRAVVACLPETKTFIKILETTSEKTTQSLHNAVLKEIEQDIPLPPNDLYYDWQLLDEKNPTTPDQKIAEDTAAPSPISTDESAPEPSPTTKQVAATQQSAHILMGAAPKNLVDSYTLMLERAGLAPIGLDIEATSIARAVIGDAEKYDEATGILDIGATRSSLVIHDSGSVRISISIPLSGIDITASISDQLGVSMEEAEILKYECGLDPDRCEDKLWKVLLPLIDDMTDKIRNALTFYRVGFPQGKKIEKILLCGGGARFKEIDTVLSRKLTIKVRRSDPLVNAYQKFPRGFHSDHALPFATAIGLGLHAADENEMYHRFL